MTTPELLEAEKCLSFLYEKQNLHVEDIRMNLSFAISDLNEFVNREYVELTNEQLGAEIRSISSRRRYLEGVFDLEVKKLSNILEELEHCRNSISLRSSVHTK